VPITRFPDPATADPDGLLAVGGSLDPITLMAAYRQGVFPWPSPGMPLLWFSPPERAIVRFADVHVSRSLRRALKLATWHYSVDRAFAQVIAACARTSRPREAGTWITTEVENAYVALHALRRAHSVEVWEDEQLIGGIYGVDVDGAFAAESMFHLRPNASKAAFLYLVAQLERSGLDWIDIQMMTPHMQRFGAQEIPRATFLRLLAATRQRRLTLFDREPERD